ncbi:hypothetical protein GCM10009592_09410 [Brachybacterium rhamnosum]
MHTVGNGVDSDGRGPQEIEPDRQTMTYTTGPVAGHPFLEISITAGHSMISPTLGRSDSRCSLHTPMWITLWTEPAKTVDIGVDNHVDAGIGARHRGESGAT